MKISFEYEAEVVKKNLDDEVGVAAGPKGPN